MGDLPLLSLTQLSSISGAAVVRSGVVVSPLRVVVTCSSVFLDIGRAILEAAKEQ